MDIRETSDHIIDWNEEKNKWLQENRGVSFELITVQLMNKEVVDIVAHNSDGYSHQYIVLINIEDYIYAVPFVLDEKREVIFLKTIIPSRKFTKKYLGKKYGKK